MSRTFNTAAKIEQVKEPLFQISRSKYRGSRSSEQENLEANLLKLDLTRIHQELNLIDDSILDEITLFIGDKFQLDQDDIPLDGLSYELEGIGLTAFDYIEGLDEILDIDIIDKLSGILFRTMSKVHRLEKGM
jgi:hypothetical protein